jgi:hypothetical protein
MTMTSRILFDCLGFSTNPVFYLLDCGYRYQIGTYYDNHGTIRGFVPHDGFLPRDKKLPELPTKEQVEAEYLKRLSGIPKITNDIVYAG